MADASIEIAEYDATWPAKFDAERVVLEVVLVPWLVGPVEHIGSTSVVGMAAKPVIAIMAAVDTLEASRPAINALPAAGIATTRINPACRLYSGSVGAERHNDVDVSECRSGPLGEK